MPSQATCAEAGLASGHRPRLPTTAPRDSATRKRPRGDDAASAMRRRQSPCRASPGRRISVTCGSAATASSSRVTGRASRLRASRTHELAPVGERHLDLSSQLGHGVASLGPASEKRRPGPALRRPGPAPVDCCRPTSPAAARRAPRWRPAPRRGAPPARGTASSSRSPCPARWQNLTVSGSPPCSPQMPTLRSGRVLRPLLDADLDQLADALLVEGRERVGRPDLLLRRYSGRNLPASSRLTPNVICVRSLVPKLKNSATSAISSAVSAARGISIIVPTR